ncbi:MAG: family 20 glycosylhydrolase [Bacteroidales bacterium]|nr:family 20 glycosylhydrolase [Bacteroidales bacterium]
MIKAEGLIPVIPSPQRINMLNGSFALSQDINIIITGSDYEKNLFTAGLLQKCLIDFFYLSPVINQVNDSERKSYKNIILLEEIENINKSDEESYKIKIDSDYIHITAFSQKGLFYGTMTMLQLLERLSEHHPFFKNENFKDPLLEYTLPCMEIYDYPDMQFRGISDDISRGQVSNLDNFKRIIRELARYKMNTYMPYIEDVMQFECYPSIGKGRGALTKSEIRELVNYAALYHIEIIPIFQTLGHYENILVEDEFIRYAEFPGAASLDVSSDSTYVFLERLLNEVFAAFPSKYINIGADESYDVGLGSSRQLVAKTDIAVVHANHYKKVYDICKKNGKEVMMYSDIVLQHPKIIDLIPKDIIMIDWHYNVSDNYLSAKTFDTAGFTYMVSPAVWNFYTTFPVNVAAIPNIKYIIQSGKANKAKGMINSNWGDFGAESFKELNYLTYAWSAHLAWNSSSSLFSDFSKIYFNDFYGIDHPCINHIYQALSYPFNQVNWNDLWRHPLLPSREPPLWEGKKNNVMKIEWIDWSTAEMDNQLDNLEKMVTKNKESIELLRYNFNILKYYKFKMQTSILLARRLENQIQDDELIKNNINSNISMLVKLRSEYPLIWLKYYKNDNLNYIIDKFNRLIDYWTEIYQDIENKSLAPPLLKSKWIYLKDKEINGISAAEFRKEIELDTIPESAFLQFIGDTHSKLFINRQFVERIVACRTLSISVEYKRIKLIDIKPYLVKGKNTIEIYTENYKKDQNAGFNLIASIKTKNKNIELLSDESWLGRKTKDKKWSNNLRTEPAKTIIAPNFKTLRKSWIER